MSKKTRTRRPTLGANPLDSYVGATTPARRRRATPPAVTASPRPKKIRATFHLRADLFEEVRNCVVALSGPPHRLTLAALAEDALEAQLTKLRKSANKGRPFPKRVGQLRGGRPSGS